ncbi:MAG: hypothetical protein A2X49_06970 [Lentisphaerae bacterium GWF2_52_8]|nr:MAG: hypothetical protein A2X49_06970 [Lentisphaerae bacterium GWF2_52_8]
MIKSILLHLSMNMWEDSYPDSFNGMQTYMKDRAWSDKLQFDKGTWKRVLEHFSASGGNMVIIDVGDGVVFKSHPEIAVQGALSREALRDELKRCADLGLEAIPKLNFSSCHDAWMRDYSRMLSTPQYYAVCKDLIAETCELFASPRFFHIGMDEETAAHQQYYQYVVVRQGELWWHDLNFYCAECARNGARAWMWSDKIWHCLDEEFRRNVPANVLQSNWYYDGRFDLENLNDARKTWIEAYLRLDRLGYEQVPAGSNWACNTNYEGTVRFCEKHLDRQRLLGFMTAPWYTTEPHNEERLFAACDEVAAAHKQ